MMNWPDNKRIAVMMAFDLDAETMWTTHGDGSTAHMTNLSRGAYGPKQEMCIRDRYHPATGTPVHSYNRDHFFYQFLERVCMAGAHLKEQGLSLIHI